METEDGYCPKCNSYGNVHDPSKHPTSRKRAGGLDTSTADGYAAWQRQGYQYDPLPPKVEVTTFTDEPDRATIKANGMVVDVIANDDGSLYVECYAYEGRASQAVVEEAFINRYAFRHPNFRMRLANAPGGQLPSSQDPDAHD